MTKNIDELIQHKLLAIAEFLGQYEDDGEITSNPEFLRLNSEYRDLQIQKRIKEESQ